MANILDIYKEYKIMPALQMHMLRVAAVASMICDNFDGTLPKNDIVTAALLHDMGNIIKFKLDYFPKFLEPEGIEYWQGVKDEYVKKYGNDEHVASIKIGEEIHLSDKILELIKAISFSGAMDSAAGDDFSHKIVEYCDDRAVPHGIVSLEDRLLDLRTRYAHKGGDTPERRAFQDAVRMIEKQIFAKCSIKPEDITDESIAPIIAELKSFALK
jgi:hypothetical protein